MDLPRVLIFGQPFNYRYGGGITLSNLFHGWSKDRIAVAANAHMMYSLSTDICDEYYQLGSSEYEWYFPFNYLQRQFKSGRLHFEQAREPSGKKRKKGIRYLIVNKFFYPFLEFVGLFHVLTRIRMSEGFKRWLSDFNPEVLYIQVSTREALLFASKLIDYLKIPSVIHVMDDWPETISSRGLLKAYWSNKIDKEFKILLTKIDLCLSISESMSEEYLKRYGRKFLPFHNPIDTTMYKKPELNDELSVKRLKMLYLGRIGVANKHTISRFSRSLSKLSIERGNIELDIYSSDIDTPEAKRLNSLHGVNLYPAVSHEEVPGLLSRYDLLFLPLDFTKSGLKYAQYSIPTKSSEYMASGVPILACAPAQTAISKFLQKHNCGHCLTELEPDKIEDAIQLLADDAEYRRLLSSNATTVAFVKFDARKVRSEFQSLISNLAKKLFNT